MSRKNEKPSDIDPKIKLMLDLMKKEKVNEKDKQAKIYNAMEKIEIIRS